MKRRGLADGGPKNEIQNLTMAWDALDYLRQSERLLGLKITNSL